MDKIEVQKEIEKILNSHESKLHQLVSDGYRIVIKLGKDEPANVEVTNQIDTAGRNSGIRIQHIDEGFGSLSGEPLQNAINTLRSLHTKSGRHVGIISHIEEVQERIPIQIQVIQEGNNSNSKVQVVSIA